MTLLTLICVLVLEQFRPLSPNSLVWQLFGQYADYLEYHLNAGVPSHAYFAWFSAVFPPLGIAWLIYHVLLGVSPALAWFWNGLILYLTMGFRQFSGPFSRIVQALAEGRTLDAQLILKEWSGKASVNLSVENNLSRYAIEQGVVDSYRYVFGTMFWFVVLPGPVGAVLFRCASVVSDRWTKAGTQKDTLGKCAARITHWLDWIPVRLTAMSFAIMGNLEDAIYCWRSYAKNWKTSTRGILLAAAAGALGVRLGEVPNHQGGEATDLLYGLASSEEADAYSLKRAAGLIWRSVLLWLFAILLLSFVH